MVKQIEKVSIVRCENYKQKNVDKAIEILAKKKGFKRASPKTSEVLKTSPVTINLIYF